MHHTIDKVPSNSSDEKKYKWQKEHKENKTGTKEKFKPVEIKKSNTKKKYEIWK